TQALWRKNGIGASDDGEAEDPLMRDTPWLAGLYAHGVRGRIATGPNIGKRIRTGGGGESEEAEPSARRCANVDGFSVHANVSLPAHQRAKLENLCRYMLRAPLAVEEALALAHRTGERYYEAELYRLKGELLLMQPARRSVAQAATGGKAVVVAEAPAVPEEARSLLAEVYDRFTEGFDTMDLREAKVLLDALS
ncbi:MAG TPA: hypothetical protein VKE70_27415, partial [Candidatus Solibacter sp.]|nr:hypothetical protein [Candidatus Solibacter sp.]